MSQPLPGTSQPELAFGLRWGIKQSFIDYVRRMPGGRGAAGSGARLVGADEILYEPDPSVPEPAALADGDRFWAFRGDVRFHGHFGMLFVRVAFPWLTLRGEEAELTVEDPDQTEGAARLSLVTMRLSAQPATVGCETWNGSDVRLTEAGTGLFNEVYPPGEPFEGLTLTVPAHSGGSR
jgi:hypothetical protein